MNTCVVCLLPWVEQSIFLFQVYCQVIKQTNHVPQPNSPANRAHWHLLTCMSCTFLPSRAILRYLRFHLKRFAHLNELWNAFYFRRKANSKRCVQCWYQGARALPGDRHRALCHFHRRIPEEDQGPGVCPLAGGDCRPAGETGDEHHRLLSWRRLVQDLHQFAHHGRRGTGQTHHPAIVKARGNTRELKLFVFGVATAAGCGEVDQRSGHGGQQEPVLSVRAQFLHRPSFGEPSHRGRCACQV